MSLFVTVVECAIEHEGKILVIERPKGKHAGGLLSFPGGKVEAADAQDSGDVLVCAIKREVFEEVGLKLDVPIRYVTSSRFTDSVTGNPVVDVIFYCQLDSIPESMEVCAGEVPRYHGLEREEIVGRSNCPEWLERYLRLIPQDRARPGPVSMVRRSK